MGTLNGKVAIVTGAGKGIGRGIALALASEGVIVAATSRSHSSAHATARDILANGGKAFAFAVNAGDRPGVFAMVEKTVDKTGRLDILVNTAQSFGPAAKPAAAPFNQPLETFDEDEWEHTMRTGLMGTLWAMKAAFPHMKNAGGRIINFASGMGLQAFEGTAAYNCTKEAIRTLTRTAAREWGKYGILVNTITPVVRTPAFQSTMQGLEQEHPGVEESVRLQIPLRRFGDPLKDAGGLAIFLSSEQSSFMTGMNFMLDGGMCMLP